MSIRKKTRALICPECDSGKLQSKKTELTGKVRGESFQIPFDALVCPNCGFKTVTKERAAKFALAIADAYREANGFLTSIELIGRRKQFGMTQADFARYTGVSLPSLKRWELGQIQDRTGDYLIRVRTDLSTARANLQNLEQINATQHISSGAIGDFDIDLSVFRQPPFVIRKASRWSVDVSAMRYGELQFDAA